MLSLTTSAIARFGITAAVAGVEGLGDGDGDGDGDDDAIGDPFVLEAAGDVDAFVDPDAKADDDGWATPPSGRPMRAEPSSAPPRIAAMPTTPMVAKIPVCGKTAGINVLDRWHCPTGSADIAAQHTTGT